MSNGMKTTPVACVTGGGKGIGRAIAVALHRKGYRVYVSYNNSSLQANELADLFDIVPIKTDIRCLNEVEALANTILTAEGRIDLLVNNAGIAQQKLFSDITPSDWDDMFDVNVKGSYHTCHCFLPQMIRQKYGRIINISSIWGEAGASCEVHYSASKAAVIGFTKALAREVGLSGITVNCICPGVIETDMNAMLDTAILDELREQTSVNRLGTPEDVAALAVFLAGEDAGFITGQVITCDGGML